MWSGYVTVGGMELSNAGRVEAYAGVNPWFKPLYNANNLYLALNDDPYRTPLLDAAPWVDGTQPASTGFFGFYLLDVTGIEDSSRQVTFTEGTGDGGRPSRVRHNSKTIVFDGVLIGCDECSTEYGMRWLRSVLLASPCEGETGGCAGTSLCFFSCEPCTTETDDPACWDEAVNRVGRSMRKFAVTSGPTITSKSRTVDGSVIWRVTFTGQAGVPWIYGYEHCIVENFLDPTVTNPYCEGVDGSFTGIGDGYEVNDLNENGENPCAVQVWAPVYDPECPPLDPPPGPPSVQIGCVDAPTTWTRYKFTVPENLVPLWTDMVPVLSVTTAAEAVRNMRIRFYSDPFGTGNPDEDPCAFCGDFLFTYLPPNTIMTLDGSTEQVTALSQNQPVRNASSLVYAADGAPFEFPLLSCGVGYTVTIDLPVDTPAIPIVNLSLVARAS